MKTIVAARGKWRGILSKWIPDEYFTGKHCACPLCGGKDRFRFLDHNGSGSWVCNQCAPTPEDGMSLLMKYTGRAFAELAREIDQEIGNIKPDAPTPKRNPSKVLDKVASGVKRELRFTPVHRYLVKRGIKLIPQNVGYHPELGYYEDGKLVNQFPAMVARIITVKGQRISFHVTYLTNSGEKAGVSSPKKILAPLEPGVGVYLDQPGESIVVGEGIETTLAGMQLFGLPGIAGLNAGGLEGLQVPSFVRSVTVLADADQNYTGQAAAFALAKRLVREGKEVSVEVPDMGLDYADMLFN